MIFARADFANVHCVLRGTQDVTQERDQNKNPGEFPHRGFCFLCFNLFYLPVNSANSVELLIFVTNQGSGPRLVEACSMITRPIGVGP